MAVALISMQARFPESDRSDIVTIKDARRGQQVTPCGLNSGKILRMRTSLLWTAILFEARCLFQRRARRAASAPSAQLTTASIVPSTREVAPPAREYVLQIANQSNHTVKLPRQPDFGWRVEIREKRGWKLRAEGGPVHLLKAEERHVVNTSADSGPLVKLAPTQSDLFYFVCPDAKKSLEPEGQMSRLRLSVYWSPHRRSGGEGTGDSALRAGCHMGGGQPEDSSRRVNGAG